MRGKQVAGLAVVILLMAGIIVAKSLKKSPPTAADPTVSQPSQATGPMAPPPAAVTAASRPSPPRSSAEPPSKKLPRLLELGSTTCIPCQQMAPILEELRAELQGKVAVDFVDVYEDQTAADRYGIQIIPTQVFFDAEGKELFRHEGVFPKAEILAKMKELGMLRK